jgi:thiamine-phosphate pyrophosphorylase
VTRPDPPSPLVPRADAPRPADPSTPAGGTSGTAGDRWGLAGRRLYLCTPDRPDLEAFVGHCIDGGVDVVQLREKHLGDTALVARAAVVRRVCAAAGVPFVLNDRPDLAADVGADGVHVGQDDVSPAEARAVLGDTAIIGLSTHAPVELAVALGEGPGGPTPPLPVDYLSAGPVLPTPTKPGRPGTGADYVTEAVRRSPWPVWVTGGVDPDSVGGLVEAGARHFVVVRWLVDAADPASAARALRQRIDLLVDAAG